MTVAMDDLIDDWSDEPTLSDTEAADLADELLAAINGWRESRGMEPVRWADDQLPVDDKPSTED